MMMEAANTFETSVKYQTTRPNDPEGSHLPSSVLLCDDVEEDEMHLQVAARKHKTHAYE
jgi:hypothetical protein